MLEIGPDNATEYLRERGLLPGDVAARVEALAWGVSNVVLRVDPERGPSFVVKQSRAQLRTKAPWFSRIDRVFREVAAMKLLRPLLPAGVVPAVLFEDRENYLFGMEAAPADHRVWKQDLLAGHADPAVAAFLGTCLAAIHRETAGSDMVRAELGDTEVFVQLRVDPFYRDIAGKFPEVAGSIEWMIAEMFARPVCLVHADFSPKNVLLSGRQTVLVDYETAHYGDPAFDLGFFLSHLLLKSALHRASFDAYVGLTTAFWETYDRGLAPVADREAFAPAALRARTMPHLAGCMWARIDGTSPIDYLPQEADRMAVRTFCRELLLDPPAGWPQVIERLVRLLPT